MKDWNPQDIKDALDLEAIGEEGKPPPDAEGIAKDKVYQSAPIMTEAIIHLALYSDNENMRFKAASYLLDRALGKVTDQPVRATDAKTQLERFAENVRTGSSN